MAAPVFLPCRFEFALLIACVPGDTLPTMPSERRNEFTVYWQIPNSSPTTLGDSIFVTGRIKCSQLRAEGGSQVEVWVYDCFDRYD